MKHTKTTRKALVASVMSLLLCVSMLIGSTFAWFTDTDAAATSNIVAGTLDVEIIDEKGNEKTDELKFLDVKGESPDYWEPGATFHTEQFAIKNNGNLNLKFKLDIRGAKISEGKLNEVIKFVLVEVNEDNEIVAEYAIKNNGTDNTVLMKDIPLAPLNDPNGKDTSNYFYIKATMDKNAGNDYQKLTLSGLNIVVYATQATGEYDIIGDQYDAGATYDGELVLVKTADDFVKAFAELKAGQIISLAADIDMTGKTWKPVNDKGFTLNGNYHTVKGLSNGLVGHTGSGEFTVKNITFDKMTVTNSYENASYSYAGLIGDADTCSYILMENVTISNSVIKSTKGTTGYAGGFVAYTTGYDNDNNGAVYASHNFVNCTLIDSTVEGTSSAGGLIGHCGGNPAITTSINGVKIVTSSIVGVDATKTGNILGTSHVGVVNLTYDVSDVQTGAIIGRFVPGTTGKLTVNGVEQVAFANETSTVPAKVEKIEPTEGKTAQESLNEVINNAEADKTVAVVLPTGSYTLPTTSNKDIVISGDNDTVIDLTNAVNASNSTITMEGVTVNVEGDGTYKGIQHAEKVVYNDVTFNGTQFLYSDAEFTNCTFNVNGNKYNIWVYGNDATFTNCTFNCDGKSVLQYNEGTLTAEVTFQNCTFNDNGDDTVTGKAAIEVAESANGCQATYTININKCTVNGFVVTGQESATFGGTDLGTNVWGNKNLMPADRLHIVIDGTEVY